MIHANYISSLNNVEVVWYSRYLSEKSNWQLDPLIFEEINALKGSFQVKFFDTQLSRFYSWCPGPEAVDMFLQDWSLGTL